MDDMVRCSGGPCDSRWVSAVLGPRWPAAVAADSRSILLGYYVLVDGEFVWDPATVQTVILER